MKKNSLLLLLLFSFVLNAQNPMILRVNALGGTNNVHIKLVATGVSSGGPWSFPYTFVKANDPTVTGGGNATLSATEKIMFPEPGEYIFSLYPSSNNHNFAFQFNSSQLNQGDRAKILEIIQWGNMNWSENISRMFQSCTNLVISATDIPDFSQVTDMSYLFSDCSSLTTVPNIDQWQTSNVTNIDGMFSSCSSFNQNISAFDISSITSFMGLFYGCSSFNQPLTWNTAAITEMNSMFSYATSFNQDISNWNVSSVTNMENMFSGASSFQQDISAWDVSNVFSFANMFANATSFNHRLGEWDLISAVNINGMLYNAGLSCENYSLTLKGWSEGSFTPHSLSLDSTGRSYGLQGKIYRDVLVNDKNWNITGDIYNASCILSTKENALKTLFTYPNPTTGILYLKANKKEQLTLINQAGQVIRNIHVVAGENQINISDLAAGVYFLKGLNLTHKILKK